MSDPTTITVQQLIDQFLANEGLHVSAPSPCPYLRDRDNRVECLCINELNPAVYEAFMDRGFRRNGMVLYRPICDGCAECKQVRIAPANFTLSRSLRRIWRRNHDLRVEVCMPEPTAEKLAMFRRYLDARHDGTMTGSEDEFHDFLYASPVFTLEVRYYLGERLVGVSLVDRGVRSLSSVYMFFEPAYARRGLGTFSILWEIDLCWRLELPHYYLGYYVAGCPAMSYKARFRPCQVLSDHRHWVTLGE